MEKLKNELERFYENKVNRLYDPEPDGTNTGRRIANTFKFGKKKQY